jgi:hypothetical protein
LARRFFPAAAEYCGLPIFSAERGQPVSKKLPAFRLLVRSFEHITSMAHPDVMEKLVSLAKRRGFIFQSSEIYGGTGSVWDYGPLGVELKKNL